MITVNWDMPFEEMVEYFESKGIRMSPSGWREIWKQANARAFTVARVTAMDVLQDIREAITEAIDKGTPLKEFKAGLSETLESKGWLAPKGEKAKVVMPDGSIRKRLTGWRLDTIFGTNNAAAYSVGRYKQQMAVKAQRPYWTYKTVEDISVRPSHAEHNGKVRHADHPFWQTWYPPNGFNCRCYVRSLSARQMREMGLSETKEGTDFVPDEGFNYNPGKAGLDAWRPDLSGYPDEAGRLLAEELHEARRSRDMNAD